MPNKKGKNMVYQILYQLFDKNYLNKVMFFGMDRQSDKEFNWDRRRELKLNPLM